MGWLDHPIFLLKSGWPLQLSLRGGVGHPLDQGVAPATPNRSLGLVDATPRLSWGGRPPLKEKMGWPNHPMFLKKKLFFYYLFIYLFFKFK